MIKLQKILCSVDFSECSLEALNYAIHLALRENATLYLIHIVDSRIYDYGGPIYEPEATVIQPKMDQEFNDRLKDKLLEKVPKEMKEKVETETAKVREVISSEDTAAIREATDALMSVVQELGAAAYQQSEPAAETEPGEAESEPESGEEDGEDVVEGDFRNE